MLKGGDGFNSSLCGALGLGEIPDSRALPCLSLLRAFGGGREGAPPGGLPEGPAAWPFPDAHFCPQAVGCDRRLGSSAREDNCGVCAGNGSTCRLVRGQSKSHVSPEKSRFETPLPGRGPAGQPALRLRPELSFPGVRRRGPVLQKSHFFQSLSLAFWVPAFFSQDCLFL